MDLSRRTFLAGLLGGAGSLLAESRPEAHGLEAHGERSRPSPVAVGGRRRSLSGSLDPWIEVDPDALRHNFTEVRRLAGGRSVLAVIKNNGYGAGTVRAGRALEGVEGLAGLAVVKVEEALELRKAGIRSLILYMGTATPTALEELVRREVTLSAFTPEDPRRLSRISRRLGRPVPVHLYLDVGMGRMGIPDHRALPWHRRLASAEGIEVKGTYMTFTEVEDFDPEQLARFRRYEEEARGEGLPLGALHAASSNPLFTVPEAGLDRVRPGLLLYGGYPSGAEREDADLRPALRLRARVVRVERLRPGDGVSYGRRYVADEETWTATLPVGHADGYPRRAVGGCRVLIGERTYPVVGAVSASHTIVELGEERTVEPGEVATLVGPDHPDVHPNEVAARAGVSVYDVFMHLGGNLPRRTVSEEPEAGGVGR